MKPAFNPQHLSKDVLQPLRLVTDPLADAVVTQIITSGHAKEINQILMTLLCNDSFHPGMFSSFGKPLSDLLDDYLIASAQLPSWADEQMLKRAERFFELYGPEIFLLLNVSSLPMCYCCANGATVLYNTGRLLTHNGDVDPLARRLMETAQMIVNVHSPGGLSSGGRGVITIQKVRLIHASIRYYLKHRGNEPWAVATLGEPINQEDLAGTLMSFGPVILAGLLRLGARITEEDKIAWMHSWNVTGYLLGIQESLLPDTYEQGFQLATTILNHEAAPSEQGKALTASCLQFMKTMVPGNAFDQVPAYLMWYFLQDFSQSSGKDLQSYIGVDTHGNLKDKLCVALTHFVTHGLSEADSHASLVCKIVTSFNRLLLQGMIYHYNGGKRVQFCIPPSLQGSWGLLDQWKDYKSTPSLFGNRITWQKSSDVINNKS